MPNTDLIQVTQLPVIIQHLERKSAEIQQKTQQAMSLAVSPETLTDVKKVRADLNKDFEELEDSRKAVKKAIMAPYDEFEGFYRKYITQPFTEAGKDLGAKIFEVEQGIIGACIEELQAYAAELIQAEHLDGWLTWDRLEIRVTLSEAKQKTHKKLREAVSAKVCGIAESVRSINEMDNAEELMVEYQKSLNLSNAISVVADRHRQMEEQRQARADWEARQAADRQAVERVDAVAPPVAAPVPVAAPIEDGKVYTCKFTVHATKAQLKQLKGFMIQEGIRYE